MAVWRTPNSNTTLTSAVGWDTNVNTPTLHASTSINTTNVSDKFTATFTAPNTTNKVTGVWFYTSGVSNATSSRQVITLQESTVDTVCTATINNNQFTNSAANDSGWFYVRFATPYTFTTTSAGAYRFRVRTQDSISISLAADSGGTTLAFIATTDITGAPAATDLLWIGGDMATGTTITATVPPGTNLLGQGGTDVSTTIRTIGHSIHIGQNGVLTWDTTGASAELVVKGGLLSTSCSGNLAFAAGPTYSIVNYLTMDQTGTVGPGTGTTSLGIYNTGKMTGGGLDRTSQWHSTYTSGLGTAVSPMLTAGDIGNVGDEVWVFPTSNNAANYSEGEKRFIITRNSATSYVLSNTSGGVEAALVNTHASGAEIVNFTRNFVIRSINPSTTGLYLLSNTQRTGGQNISWIAIPNGGTNSRGVFQLSAGQTDVTGMNYCVIRDSVREWFALTSTGIAASYTGNIFFQQGANFNGSSITAPAGNKTFTDCYWIRASRSAITLQIASTTFKNCRFVAGNTDGAGVTACLLIGPSANVTYDTCYFNCNRADALRFGNAQDQMFKFCQFGTSGQNSSYDIFCDLNVYNTATFDICTFGSTTGIISGLSTDFVGSEMRFQKLNNIANNHRWDEVYGSAVSTGAGLTDTTVRTAGSLGMKISPTDATTGFTWSPYVVAVPGTTVFLSGYWQKNSTYGSQVAKVELFLPGSGLVTGTADATYTMSNTTGSWQPFNLSAYYSGTETLLAQVKFTCLATSGAIYFDDFYDAGTSNKIAGFDLWNGGKPASIFVANDISGIPGLVWQYPTANLTTTGTTGKTLVDAEAEADLASIR